jgi:hypothetical protein
MYTEDQVRDMLERYEKDQCTAAEISLLHKAVDLMMADSPPVVLSVLEAVASRDRIWQNLKEKLSLQD